MQSAKSSASPLRIQCRLSKVVSVYQCCMSSRHLLARLRTTHTPQTPVWQRFRRQFVVALDRSGQPRSIRTVFDAPNPTRKNIQRSGDYQERASFAPMNSTPNPGTVRCVEHHAIMCVIYHRRNANRRHSPKMLRSTVSLIAVYVCFQGSPHVLSTRIRQKRISTPRYSRRKKRKRGNKNKKTYEVKVNTKKNCYLQQKCIKRKKNARSW